MLNSLPFSANILNAQKFVLNIDTNAYHERKVLDYELDFYINGGRKMLLNGKKFYISDNSIVFRRPGDHIISYGNYNCYILTIDFSQKKEEFYGNYDRDNPLNTMQEISSNKLLDLIPNHFISEKKSEYIKIYEELCYHSHKDNAQTTKSLLLNQLFCLIISDVCHHALKFNREEPENIILSETHKYIEENFGQTITLEELAKNVCISPSHFSKKFKESTNMSPMEYVLNIRLTNAKHLLSSSNLSIYEIAKVCGFNDAAYFSYYFKKKFEISPKKYRNQSTLI